MKLENFDTMFMSLSEFLEESKEYLNSEIFKYLSKFKDTHAVLKKAQTIYFDEPIEMDEVFSPALLIPNYQVENLKSIIDNEMFGVGLESSFNHSYPYEYDTLQSFISISTSRDNLYVYPHVSIIPTGNGHIALIGRDGVPIIDYNETEMASVHQGKAPTACTMYANSSELNNIDLYSNAEDVPIKDLSKYLIEQIFDNTDLIVLSRCSKKVIDKVYPIITIRNFVDMALDNIYKKILNGNIANSLNGNIKYTGNGTFEYTYKNIGFNGRLCYDIKSNKLLLAAFEPEDCDRDRRFVSFVENKLLKSLRQTDLQLTAQVKNLGKLLRLLKDVTTIKVKDLIETLSDKEYKINYYLRNYPIDFMDGNIGSIINKCMLDSVGYE